MVQAKERTQMLKEIVRKKKEVPCADCGVQYPHYVMDFDHIRGDKVANVSALALRGNLPLLLEEILKCEIVCANCHRARTWNRLQM